MFASHPKLHEDVNFAGFVCERWKQLALTGVGRGVRGAYVMSGAFHDDKL